MSERTRRVTGQPEPTIPDGGLGEAMPAWLRRPPAWRTLDGPPSPPKRILPPPDFSEIDPATLVTIDDLPAWLRKLAASPGHPSTANAQPVATPRRRVIPRVIEAASKPAPPDVSASAPSAISDPSPVESAPRDGSGLPGSPPDDHTEAHDHVEPARSSAATVLGTLLGVAVVTIAVLLVFLLT